MMSLYANYIRLARPKYVVYAVFLAGEVIEYGVNIRFWPTLNSRQCTTVFLVESNKPIKLQK